MSARQTTKGATGSRTQTPGSAPQWIGDTAALERLVSEVGDGDAYAIDTEFHRERTYFPQLALIQIGWSGGIALIDPFDIDLAPLRKLFDSDVLAVFHAADQDLEVLDCACGAIPRHLWDTQLGAGFIGFSTPSLATLCERILGVRLSKGDRLTDWTRRPLSAAQCDYAASDVAHLLQLRTSILDQLELTGRTTWVDDEIELMRERPRNVVHGTRAWLRLKDGRALRGRDRLVAQELCAWREQRARLEDKPLRFVLPDLAVVSLSQAKPTAVEELSSVRGMDSRYAKSGAGAEIIAAIARGASLPADALSLPEPEDFDRRLRPLLGLASAWLAQLAQDARIDPALLATRSDLVTFLRGDADARLAMGWRHELAGSGVSQLLSGQAALAFERSGRLTLEQRSNQAIAPSLVVPTARWVLDAAKASTPAETESD